ncbi:MAG TPA: hypothetical protein VF458_14335 [Ktedonobacteraceae bacterium]
MLMEKRRERFAAQKGEEGYSWLYRGSALYGGVRVLLTLIVISGAAAFFAWYSSTSDDTAPDSLVGLVYASIGTLLLLLAATLFSLRRRSHRQRQLGGLRSSLGWHMCFALMGLAFLGMHSFGEFNPRTGTYALYGMVALVISGLIGRMLDRLMPRLIAGEAHQALTAQGEDRIENISDRLKSIVVHNTQDIRGFSVKGDAPRSSSRSLAPLPQGRTMLGADRALRTPWDLAYISLESTPQELSRETGSFRLVPDKKSNLLRPGALMPGTQEHMGELEEVKHAMQRELFYRYVIRYWRKFHVLLALTTIGLLIWHIVYALQLMLPVFFH